MARFWTTIDSVTASRICRIRVLAAAAAIAAPARVVAVFVSSQGMSFAVLASSNVCVVSDGLVQTYERSAQLSCIENSFKLKPSVAFVLARHFDDLLVC